MIQKPIREFNGVPYTNAEADELTQELNDRTESAQSGYNSVDELATKVKGTETDITALEGADYMYKGTYDTNNNGKPDDSDKLGGQNPSYYDQQSQLDTHTGDTNIHLSTDERAAITATPTPPSAGNAFATQADIAASGNGDMLVSQYGGTDGNTVRNSDKLDGQLPSVYNQSAHAADVLTNPHSVTKAQVGLGNVDNTTDADKPISTATQTALDGKVDDAQVLTNVPLGAVFTDTVYDDTPVTQNTSDITDRLKSVTVGEPAGSDIVINMVSLTQAEYNAGTPNATTFYVITDA